MILRTLAVMVVLLVGLAVGGCADADSATPWELTEPSKQEPVTEAAEDDETVDDEAVDDEAVDDETPSTDDPDVPDENPGLETFAGVWLVDQPAHALYEATLYDFQRDGTLVEVDSFSYGGPVPTGKVGECLETETQTHEECDANQTCETIEVTYCVEHGTTCLFDDYWYSTAEDVLVIGLSCDDGVAREATLDFGGIPETSFLTPVEVSVDGESNWEHVGFRWAWTRCADVPEERCQFPED